ncbi:MAG: PDZ domain-containing protein [candidate division Zixibacteria bacterium]|nr:PDZ domain-containing protein [candidate division Zixibacteria bacterium]
MKQLQYMAMIFCLLCLSPAAQETIGDYLPSPDTAGSISDSISWRDTLPLNPDPPVVLFETGNYYLLRSFYPDYYASDYRIKRDLRQIIRGDSSLYTQWDSIGVTALGLIEMFSGIRWEERILTVHPVKYLPVDGMAEPLVIPMEGIKRRDYTEAAPRGIYRQVNLIKQLAARNLLQYRHGGYRDVYFAGHPLMEGGIYRFDVMSLCIAVKCAELLFPADSLDAIYSSDSWKRHNPGWELFRRNFRDTWELTADSTLYYYVKREPYHSPLVALTVPPRVRRTSENEVPRQEQVRLGAGGGRLGFSVIRDEKGYLEVVDIDSTGLAYANGLMVGDKIRRVNGEYARNARELMGRILDKLDTEGVYLIAIRDNEEIGLLLLPLQEEY